MTDDELEELRARVAAALKPLRAKPVPRPDVSDALEQARGRLGVDHAARRRDGMPHEQMTLDQA